MESIMRSNRRVSKLCNLSAAEVKVEFDDKMEHCFEMLQTRLNNLSEKERQNAMVDLASSDQKQHDDVSLGLLFGILVTKPADKNKAQLFYRELQFITNDGWNNTLTNVIFILVEWFHKLKDSVREQLIWFLSEAIRGGVPNMDNVCTHALRNIRSGDISPQNIKLSESIVGILNENSDWLKSVKSKSALIPNVVYTYLRLLCDHNQPSMDGIRQKEVRFVVWLIREKFQDCLPIGKDLLRLLIVNAKIPEIYKLWQDILYNPSSLAPGFAGVMDLLLMRTSSLTRRCLTNRLPVLLERELVFLLKEVKYARHERHWLWFTSKYLSKPENSTIRVDIIRFILCCAPCDSPPDNVKRWHVLNWLLPNSLSATESQLCKMALFWDWLFLDPAAAPSGTCALIEPVYSLLLHCLKSQVTISSTLLDFMCRSSLEFFPVLKEKIRVSLTTGFRHLVDHKIAMSLTPLLCSQKIEKKLRTQLQEFFPEFCRISAGFTEVDKNVPVVAAPVVEVKEESLGSFEGATFSDDDAPEPYGKTIDSADAVKTRSQYRVKKKRRVESEAESLPSRVCSPPSTLLSLDIEEDEDLDTENDHMKTIDIEPVVQQLDERLKEAVKELQNCPLDDEDSRCSSMQKLLLVLLENEDDFSDQISTLAECMCFILRRHFRRRRLLPPDPTDESVLNESLNSSFFVIFRNVCMTPENDPSRQPLLLLIGEMYTREPKVGYQLLYFLKAFKDADDRISPYVQMCKVLGEKVDTCLVQDMDRCQSDDYRLFGYLIPHVYSYFKQDAMSSAKLMHLVVSAIDSQQLNDLIGETVQENIHFFKRETFNEILKASLEWETIEQYFFWRLVEAEDIQMDWVLSVIPRLEYPVHSEAMSAVLLFLRRLDKTPTKVLTHLLNRDPNKKNDLFVVNALKILLKSDEKSSETKSADTVEKFILKQVEAQHSRGKSKSSYSSLPCLDNVLGHLDKYRQVCYTTSSEFFTRDELREALNKAKRSSESLKEKYQELFAMVDVLATVKGHDSSRSLRRGRIGGGTSTFSKNVFTAAQDSSDEDVPAKRKPKKEKKKKVVDSESD